MYNKKSLSIICLFAFICIWVSAISIMARSKQVNSTSGKGAKSVSTSHFVNVHYFKSEGNRPNFELESTDLVIKNEVKLNFQSPKGKIIKEDTSKINYIANQGNMHQSRKILKLQGDVVLEDEQTKYHSDYLSYDGKKDLLNATGNVKTFMVDPKTRDQIEIKARNLTSVLKSEIVELSGAVDGIIRRRRRYQGTMNFGAENVLVNTLKSQIDLSNSVKIRRNNYYLTAGKAEIFLENFNKKLKYYTLYDDVKLEEKVELLKGGSQVRRAFAEKLEGHEASGKIILTGAPRVEQGKDIIKGYQITLRENVELVEVDDSKSNFSMKRKENDN